MSENPPRRPDEDPGPPGVPGGEPQPSAQQPHYQPPPPHGGQPPYGDQGYGGPPPQESMPDPGLYPGYEYPPDRSAGHRASGGPGGQSAGFFGAMFDFTFSRYITPTVVKVVYIVVVVLTAIYWLVGLIASFAQDWWVGILFLVFGWIVALLYLAFVRIVLECFVALISISQKVNAYAQRDGID